MLRRLLAASVGLLIVFHAWLFAGQVWDGQIADVALLTRWLVAAGLVAALIDLRRRGLSIIRGRQAVAIWLLAALLHGPAVAERIGQAPAPAMPEVVTLLTTAALTGALALGLRRLASLLSRARPRHSLTRAHVLRLPTLRRRADLHVHPAFAPRPPPLA